MKAEFVELIGKEHTLRVLLALRVHGPQRFKELETTLDLNPAQIDRALKWLQERVYLLAKTVPAERGPITVSYQISRRGVAFLDAFDSFVAKVDEMRDILGEESVRELEALAG